MSSRSICSTGCPRRTASCAPASRPIIRRSSRSPRAFDKVAAHPRFRFFGNVEFGTRPDARRSRAPLPPDRLRDGRPDRPAHGHSRARTWRAATPRPSSWPGTTAIRTTATGSSTSRRSASRSSASATSRWTSRASSAATPEELAKTDIADYALEALRQSRVKEVYLLGRRGPAQAAFTNPEVRELGELADADVSACPTRSSSTR